MTIDHARDTIAAIRSEDASGRHSVAFVLAETFLDEIEKLIAKAKGKSTKRPRKVAKATAV